MLLQVDGINVNFRRGSLKVAPLGLAAQRGHDAIVELLLAADNVDPNVGDRESTMPLHWACAMGHVSVVRQLLARDSIDVNAHGTIDGYRETPLMMATRKRSVEVLEALLARDDLDLNIGNDFGEHVLGLAVSQGHVDTMKLLLNHPDIDPNFVEGDSRTALMVSMRTLAGPEAVKLLLDQEGIDVNIRNNWGLTALCEASVISCCKDIETTKLLLERKDIDINLPDNYGWTPLFWACHHRCVALVDLLLEKDNIDPNPRDANTGRTPLAYVCHCRYGGFDERVASIVQSLLSHPATDPNAVDNNGVSILAGFINKYHNAVGSDSFVRQKIESLLRARILQ
jgi:ankyrin repeat protein